MKLYLTHMGRRTGKTHLLCQEVVEAIKQNKKVLIISQNSEMRGNVKDIMINTLNENQIKYYVEFFGFYYDKETEVTTNNRKLHYYLNNFLSILDLKQIKDYCKYDSFWKMFDVDIILMDELFLYDIKQIKKLFKCLDTLFPNYKGPSIHTFFTLLMPKCKEQLKKLINSDFVEKYEENELKITEDEYKTYKNIYKDEERFKIEVLGKIFY